LSTPFQNRLVGTIIVAAAVVIFLPDLLDGKKNINQTDFEAIPKAPSFTGKITHKTFPEQKLVLKELPQIINETALDLDSETSEKELSHTVVKATAQSNEIITPATKANAILAKVEPVTIEKKAVINKPVLGKHPERAVNKEAWVIQLGSFKHKRNVEELLAKLKLKGYSAFTKPIKTKKGTLTKVFVGPELIKSSLEKQISPLKKLTGVQGKIARFYPTK
jgi:DedD protein